MEKRLDFPGLSAAEAAVLASFMEPRELAPGEVLVYRGELGDDLFVLAAGQVEVRIRNGAGRSLGVRLLGPGAALLLPRLAEVDLAPSGVMYRFGD